MTREEQLQQFAEQNTKGLYLDRHNLIQMVKAGAEWADQHPNWIPVEERLPPKMGKYSKRSNEVLVITERKELFIAKYWYDGDGWAVNGFPTSKLTHWMEIVPPRKEE